MKPIMSFWSEPYIKNRHNRWINENSWNLSWILSVAAISKTYGKPHLYTDDAGKHFLVDQLGLEFESINLSLNDLNGKNSRFFSLGKIYAIGMQKEPFFHIDYDAYLFNEIAPELLDRGVFFERESIFDSTLKLGIVQRPDLLDDIKNLPSWWKTDKIFNAYKSGIVGGSNIDYFANYSKIVLDIIDSNTEEKWDLVNENIKRNSFVQSSIFSPQYTIEEVVAYGLANHMGISPRFMINNNGLIASTFAHVHGDKQVSSEFYGRIMRRIAVDYPDSMNLVNKLQPSKTISNPKVSVIVIPTEEQSSYDTVLRSLIPRKIAPNEVIVSGYNLKESDRNLLVKIEAIKLVPGMNTYMESFEAAFRKTNGQLIILIDGHVRVPKLYIEKAIASYFEYPDSVFCTTSSDFLDKPLVFSHGALQDDFGVHPNIQESQSNILDTAEVQSLYGGIYVFPSSILHAIFDTSSKLPSFNDISKFVESKGFKIRCIKSIVSSHNFKIALNNKKPVTN